MRCAYSHPDGQHWDHYQSNSSHQIGERTVRREKVGQVRHERDDEEHRQHDDRRHFSTPEESEPKPGGTPQDGKRYRQRRQRPIFGSGEEARKTTQAHATCHDEDDAVADVLSSVQLHRSIVTQYP